MDKVKAMSLYTLWRLIRSGGIVPRILSRCTTWRCVVSVTTSIGVPQRKKIPQYPLNTRQGESHNRFVGKGVLKFNKKSSLSHFWHSPFQSFTANAPFFFSISGQSTCVLWRTTWNRTGLSPSTSVFPCPYYLQLHIFPSDSTLSELPLVWVHQN